MSETAPSQLDKELSEFLRKAMLRNNWSYADLSAKTGVSRAMLQRIVTMERFATLNLLARICSGLRVSIADIFPKALSKRPANPRLEM